MRFPSQAQKKQGNPVFKWKILALFSRKAQKDTEIPFSNEVPITSPEKNTEIPFSNRRYWHYFPEVAITSPKKRKSRFQIEDIGIIFSEKPKKTRKSRFQMRFPSQAQKKTRKFRFQIEHIGSYWHYFQRLPSQAQKKGNPVFK